MIRHHPSDATLVAWAAGTLPDPHARVVAAHTALCSDCARTLGESEALGGALLETLPPEALASDALARTLARLDRPSRRVEPASVPVTLAGLARGRWRWSGPGIAMMPLIRRDRSDSRLDLIRVAPGTALLEHGHGGFETTCVLQGAFDDGVGQFHTGDFAEVETGFDHCPRALPGDDCICLIATTGHLRAHGWLGRLVGSLLGM
jgi:putative transcriptional regulator